jgi:hypothetical protein
MCICVSFLLQFAVSPVSLHLLLVWKKKRLKVHLKRPILEKLPTVRKVYKQYEIMVYNFHLKEMYLIPNPSESREECRKFSYAS